MSFLQNAFRPPRIKFAIASWAKYLSHIHLVRSTAAGRPAAAGRAARRLNSSGNQLTDECLVVLTHCYVLSEETAVLICINDSKEFFDGA